MNAWCWGRTSNSTFMLSTRRNTRIRPAHLARMIERAGAGMVMLVGVQSNQFPRALDIAAPLRERGIQVGVGGFHVSGTISMLGASIPISTAPRRMGVSLFAGEAEGRLEQVLRDAAAGALKPLYNFMNDLPGNRGRTDSADGGRACAAHGWRSDELRCRPRLPLSVFVLHDHQCAGAEIAPPLAGRRREDIVRVNLRAGLAQLFHHR